MKKKICFLGKISALTALAALAGCGGTPKTAPSGGVSVVNTDASSFRLRPVAYNELKNWRDADHAPSFIAFAKTCASVPRRAPATQIGRNPAFGSSQQWQAVCAAQSQYSPGQAREFFEQKFTPAKVEANDSGMFTGYYEPVLNASFTRDSVHRYPIFSPPARKSGLPSRAEIVNGALMGISEPVLWVSSEVDSFFLHIQGSGRAVFPNGQTAKIAYAGQNGHPYFAIGKYLADNGHIPRAQISMQSIRSWLESNPSQAQSVMNKNPSYIFFNVKQETAPVPAVGAAGVPLTPEYSMAVDKNIYPYGVPMWVQTTLPALPETGNQTSAFRRLMIAQDTGGAIKGPIRGDIFWGAGAFAEKMAGGLKNPGEKYVLLPKP